MRAKHWKQERSCKQCNEALLRPNQKLFCSRTCATKHRLEETKSALSKQAEAGTKHCKRCDEILSLDNFAVKNAVTGSRQAYCTDCNRAYQREHYQKHQTDYSTKRKTYTEENGEKVFTNLIEYLQTHPCVRCGETDLILLEFDHIDPSAKSFSVSSRLGGRYTWEAVFPEIQKCQVLCVSCHRRKTAEQMGWKKFLLFSIETA